MLNGWPMARGRRSPPLRHLTTGFAVDCRLLDCRAIGPWRGKSTMSSRPCMRSDCEHDCSIRARRWGPHPERSGEHGYTLLELLVVLSIIGLIVGLVGPRVLGQLTESKAKAAHIQIQGFAAALDIYFLDNGRYPSTSEGLAALVQKPDGLITWKGPYLKTGFVPDDSWGRPYVYVSPGEHGVYDIVSRGAEGSEAAETHITSWQR
jgi:general secretion pathway protein G